MEIGSVAHKYYLINIRLPVNERKGINVGIGEIKDIRLVVSRPLRRGRPAAGGGCRRWWEDVCLESCINLAPAFPTRGD